MQTRSSSRLARNQSSNPSASTNQNPKGRNRRRSKQRIKNLDLDDLSEPVVTMADQRTMAQLLQAPTEGYEDAIVIPAITANNFELKHGLLTLVQNKQFFRHDKEDPHAHVRYFNKITSTLKFPNVPNTSIKLMFFPFLLEGAARIWLEKEPLRSIFTWDDLVSKFINQFFPPSKTTNLRNEITNFQQRFDESFSEAWDIFKDLLRACPYHGFSELHQLDTFYNALNSKDQDSLNSAAGGNFLDRMPRECLGIIESKSNVRYSRNKPVVAKVSTTAFTSGISLDVVESKDMVRALLLDKKGQSPAPVKAVEESCVTCGINFNQGNTGYRAPMMSNHIRPPGFPPVPNNQNLQRNNQNRFLPNQNQNRASGLERQPDVAAGALRAAEDAPAVNEGDQAIQELMHAPQSPPVARTMPQRMARLEEDTHEICGTLAEQREMIDAIARDFSRFITLELGVVYLFEITVMSTMDLDGVTCLNWRISFNTHLTFTFYSKQDMDQEYPIIAKIPMLDTGKFKQWQFRMQQYLQHEHYALWKVIEFEDSYTAPESSPSTTTTSTTSGDKSGRTVTLTTEDMQNKKNDAAILKTFGGNEATKKTKKNLLKQ
nr:reverse transcriptase domain-containing protein [Tanacetum cinerariifolium]